jgi:DNA-directed RNA polymerase I, II, and III subunit RPABC2
MDTDEIIESGGDFENEEWDEEYNETEQLEETDTSDVRPELKRLYQQHPECNLDYIEQVIPKIPLQVVPPGGDKADANHRTYPFLTNFEKTKIIGLRANQISKGSVPFIAVPKHITDVRDIARLELEQKRLPFIVKRPLPNGDFEYWRLSDLLLI